MSKHVGFPSGRLIFVVTIQKVKTKEDDFGQRAEHTMLTSEGDILFWDASKSGTWLQEGMTYRVKATIKTHIKDENGVPVTIVQRVEQNKEPERIPRIATGFRRR